jgi:Lrp/AsnC family leucine-responsive transcriptional regulator
VPDPRDLKILELLQCDGRMTNEALSQAVALSPSACLVRVRRLEKAGLIAGYRADLDIEKIRPIMIAFAEVTLKRHHPDDFERFEAAIADVTEIIEAAQVSGAFDYMLKIAAPDVRRWRELVDRLLAEDIGIDKIASHILMKEAKAFRGYAVRG